MTKHTPGPWAFCNETLCQATGNYLHLGKWIGSPGLGKATAANRKLIAAAPDLLDALNDAQQALNNALSVLTNDPSFVTSIALKYAEDKARAAIDKATKE